jgi:putative ATP-dependent endonuclease of the OLD family
MRSSINAMVFYIHAEITQWEVLRSGKKLPIKKPIRIPSDQVPDNPKVIFDINEDESEGKEYINPKLKNQRTFESQFEDKYSYALIFRANKDNDGKIYKDLRFLYRECENEDWILSFRASIRNEFLQSAIIPSFRDPQNQLRLNAWSWYGKLMKALTDNSDHMKELQMAMDGVKVVADSIFEAINTAVTQSALKVAFPETTLHFQFNSDTRTDLYKSSVIYIDDGFKSQITEKGSGIQSATIIGLFNYYTRHINVISSALLCIEEPEIYLHPHGRRVISDRLDDFLENNRNQVILTTHSVEFINSARNDTNIILVKS